MEEPRLAHTVVTAPAGHPERWVGVLHGILGTRANWRSLARRVTTERPHWGAVLVDLPCHGDSRGWTGGHTVDAAAEALCATAASLGVRLDAVVGHSYGGKVALACGERRKGDLDAVVTVDAAPGARRDGRGSGSTLAVLDVLAGVPRTYGSREDFVRAVTERGVPTATARWLAMDLGVTRGKDAGDVWTLRVDVAAVRAMLDDYFARDLWSVIERPPGRMDIALVIAGRHGVYDDEAVARARAAEATVEAGRVAVTVIPEAGHWVHVDAPDAVVAAVVRALDRGDRRRLSRDAR